jgi:hypothetical protein
VKHFNRSNVALGAAALQPLPPKASLREHIVTLGGRNSVVICYVNLPMCHGLEVRHPVCMGRRVLLLHAVMHTDKAL